MQNWFMVLWNAWEILRDSAPFILLGFLLAGLLDAAFSRLRLARLLRGNSRRSVLWATLIGIPLPLCSCAVLPSALALRRRGAGKGATLSFLISTPETGLTSIFLTYALLGPFMAIYRPIAACVTGLLAGLTQNAIERRFPQQAPADTLATTDTNRVTHARGMAEREARTSERKAGSCGRCCGESAGMDMGENGIDAGATRAKMTQDGVDDGTCCESGAGSGSDGGRGHSVRAALRFTFGELFDDVFGWLVVGIVAAAIIQTWASPGMLGRIVGGPWQSMLLMLLIGIPLYVCAEASTPIAAALIASGLSPGAALVFLLVGPATNVGAIGVLGRQLGWRTVAIYLLSIAGVALGAGAIANAVLSGSAHSVVGIANEQSLLPEWVKTSGAVAFLALGIISVLRLRYVPRVAAWFHVRLTRPAWALTTRAAAGPRAALASVGRTARWLRPTWANAARWVRAVCSKLLAGSRPAAIEVVPCIKTRAIVDRDERVDKWTSQTSGKSSTLP